MCLGVEGESAVAFVTVEVVAGHRALLFGSRFDPAVHLVAGSYLGGHGYREAVTLDGLVDRLAGDINFFDGDDQRARCRPGDDYLVAGLDLAGLHIELGDAELREIFDALGDIMFDARCRRTVFRRPFAEALPEIISVPETTVEDKAETLVPRRDFLVGIGAVDDSVDGLRVAFDSNFGVLGPRARPSILKTVTPASIILFRK